MLWQVYLLKDPTTKEPRYIGWTSKGMPYRLRRHREEALRKQGADWTHKHHRANWVRSILALDKWPPPFEILESGADAAYAAAEQKWIAHYRTLGADLVNCTDGGEGLLGYKNPRPRKWSDQEKAAAKQRALDSNLAEKTRQEWATDPSKFLAWRATGEHGLTEVAARAILVEGHTRMSPTFPSEMAQKHGVAVSTIYDLLRGSTWPHLLEEVGRSLPVRRKLTEEDVAVIREAAAARLPGFYRQMAQRYGVSKASIKDVVAGRTWATKSDLQAPEKAPEPNCTEQPTPASPPPHPKQPDTATSS